MQERVARLLTGYLLLVTVVTVDLLHHSILSNLNCVLSLNALMGTEPAIPSVRTFPEQKYLTFTLRGWIAYVKGSEI